MHYLREFKGQYNYVVIHYKPLISITKTSLYKFDPLQHHFYIVKLGFTGVYIIFLILLNNIDCGYSLEPPRWGGSNEYPQSMFWAEIWKISGFLSENFLEILEVKSCICLNRHVFVMFRTKMAVQARHASTGYCLRSLTKPRQDVCQHENTPI